MADSDGPLYKQRSEKLEVRDASSGHVVFTGPGWVQLSSNGRVEIGVDVSPQFFSAPKGQHEISGATPDGLRIFAAECYWASTSNATGRTVVKFVPFRCIVRNPEARHPHWSRSRCLLKNVNALGPQAWTDGDYRCDLSSLHTGLITGELAIRAASAQPDDIVEARARAISLLSLASRTRVEAPLEDRYYGDQWVETVLVPSEFDQKPTHPLIGFSAIGAFMEQASPAFRERATAYDLEGLIAYYWRSHNEPMAEFKFIFAGVLMEALKFAWAKNLGALPADLTATGLVRGFRKPAGGWYSFKELLDMTAGHLGLAHNYSFIDNRNALFHTGRPAAE